jgi:hypothetical protein
LERARLDKRRLTARKSVGMEIAPSQQAQAGQAKNPTKARKRTTSNQHRTSTSGRWTQHGQPHEL